MGNLNDWTNRQTGEGNRGGTPTSADENDDWQSKVDSEYQQWKTSMERGNVYTPNYGTSTEMLNRYVADMRNQYSTELSGKMTPQDLAAREQALGLTKETLAEQQELQTKNLQQNLARAGITGGVGDKAVGNQALSKIADTYAKALAQYTAQYDAQMAPVLENRKMSAEQMIQKAMLEQVQLAKEQEDIITKQKIDYEKMATNDANTFYQRMYEKEYAAQQKPEQFTQGGVLYEKRDGQIVPIGKLSDMEYDSTTGEWKTKERTQLTAEEKKEQFGTTTELRRDSLELQKQKAAKTTAPKPVSIPDLKSDTKGKITGYSKHAKEDLAPGEYDKLKLMNYAYEKGLINQKPKLSRAMGGGNDTVQNWTGLKVTMPDGSGGVVQDIEQLNKLLAAGGKIG